MVVDADLGGAPVFGRAGGRFDHYDTSASALTDAREGVEAFLETRDFHFPELERYRTLSQWTAQGPLDVDARVLGR